MTQQWLRCQVDEGAFDHEVVVLVKTADGRSIAHYVPRDSVKKQRTGTFVRVAVEKAKGKNLAILPTPEPYNAIPVRAEDLTKSP